MQFDGCIFCGRMPLTKEHVLPKWMRVLVVRPEYRQQTYLQPDEAGTWDRRTFQRQGDLYTMQPRIVCGPHCNFGWMKALEDAALPRLTPFVRGEAAEVSADTAKLVATWAAKTAVTLEWTNLPTRTVPQAHRTWIMEQQEPPPNTRVYLAQYEPFVSAECWHSCMALVAPEDIALPRELPGNTHLTAVAVGRMLLLVTGSSRDWIGALALPPESRDLMVPLWPDPQAFAWPPSRNVNAQGFRQTFESYKTALYESCLEHIEPPHRFFD